MMNQALIALNIRLQEKGIDFYRGTVSPAKKQANRRKNKAAKVARRAARK
jgi:hypothetical protein